MLKWLFYSTLLRLSQKSQPHSPQLGETFMNAPLVTTPRNYVWNVNKNIVQSIFIERNAKKIGVSAEWTWVWICVGLTIPPIREPQKQTLNKITGQPLNK